MPLHNGRVRAVTKRTTSFGGIRSVATIADSGASEMQNFRILSDGSLEKRCGFETLLQSDTAIRGYWEGSFSGINYRFFVAGNILYRLSQNDSAPVRLTVLTVSNNRVCMIRFRDILYLFDGYTILYFKPETELFVSAQGYVPLYGKNWHPTQLGEVNEERNLLCNSLRVHYLNTTATQTFQLPFTASRIQAVLVNGVSISTYSFTSPSSTVTIPAACATGGEVLIAFDLDSIFSTRSALLKASHCAIYKDGYHETLLTYGNRNGYKVYRTAAVTTEMLAEARLAYPAADLLYFRETDVFSIGSPEHPITAAVQHLDRMLIFHDAGVWVARHPNALRDDMEITLYQSGIGCAAQDGAVSCRGTPIVLTPAGIGKIGLFSSDSDICTLTLISTDVADRFSESVLQNSIMRWFERDGALWIRTPTDTDGTVWVTDQNGSCWIRYTGIVANGLIDCGGNPGFTTDDGRIAQFDEGLTTDDGVPFEASYLGAFLDFSQPEDFKRAGYVSLCADSGGARIALAIENDSGTVEETFTGTDQTVPEFFGTRFGNGRFRFLRCRVTVSGVARTRIYSLSVSVTI